MLPNHLPEMIEKRTALRATPYALSERAALRPAVVAAQYECSPVIALRKRHYRLRPLRAPLSAQRRITLALSGRVEACHARRERIIQRGTRGAHATTYHGPLQRVVSRSCYNYYRAPH